MQAFPDAPGILAPPERSAFQAIHLHLTELEPDDWLALRCWNLAPDRIRGRRLWPRSRREFLDNAFEAIEHIRKWWRKDGRRWHRQQAGPTRPKPQPAAPAPTGTECTTEEALAILRSDTP